MPPEGNPEGLKSPTAEANGSAWFAAYMLTLKLRLRTILKYTLLNDAIKSIIAIMELFQ